MFPFQFSTAQGAILEFSAGIVRVWEAATEGSWSLGLALQPPTNVNYNPATAYIAGNSALIGPTVFFSNHGGSPAGRLAISSPYGTTNFPGAEIGVNTSDSLSVTVDGASPNQTVSILLANATPSKNSASLIQAAIRSMVSLNSPSNNFVDLSGWTVTPDTDYYATPWITAPNNPDLVQSNWIGECILANQNDEFPLIDIGRGSAGWNTTYWEPFNVGSQPPIELVVPYLEGDLFNLDCSTQSADVLWIFHPNYPPGMIERLTANSWQYSLSLPGQQPGEPAYRGTLDVVKTGYSASARTSL